MHGAGVFELHVGGHVPGVEAQLLIGDDQVGVGVDPGDGDRPVGVEVGDLPGVAVGHEPPAGVVGAVVAAGHDPVAHPGPVPVDQGDGDGVVDHPGGDELVADPAGQAGRLFVGVGQQERPSTQGPVGHGGGEGGVFHVRFGAAGDPGSQVVVGQDGDVAVSQAQTGVAFPVVGEAVHLAEVGGADLVDDQAERPAGLRAGQLLGVADQQQFGVRRLAQPGQVVDDLAGRHAGLVQDDQHPRFDPVPGPPGRLGLLGRGCVGRVRRAVWRR